MMNESCKDAFYIIDAIYVSMQFISNMPDTHNGKCKQLLH